MSYWHFSSASTILFVGAGISVMLGAQAWTRRPAAGSIPAALLMLAIALWQGFYGLELADTTLAGKLRWIQIEYVGILAVAPLWLTFMLEYIGYPRWVPFGLIAAANGLNVVLTAFALSPAFIPFFYRTVVMDESHVLHVVYGTAFWIHTVNSYSLFLFGTALCLGALGRASGIFRTQMILLICGATAAWICSIVQVAGLLRPMTSLDLTPFGFIISGFTTVWALSRFRLFDVAPVARNVVFETLNDGVLAIDVGGRIIDGNHAFSDICGVPVATLIGRKFREALPDWPPLTDALGDPAVRHADLTLTRDGEERFYDLTLSPLPVRHSRTTGLLVVARDITSRRRAEEAITRAKREWEMTFDTVPDLIMIVDQQHRIVRINRAMAERLGQTPEHCIGQMCFGMVHDADGPPPFCPHTLLLNDQREHSTEEYESRLGGDFLITVTPMYGDDGVLLGSVHVARDITDRKRYEDALFAEKERLAITLRAIADGVLATDSQGHVVLMNAVAERLTGWAQDDAVGHRWVSVAPLLVEQTREPGPDLVARALETGHTVTLEQPLLLQTRESGECLLAVSAAPIRDRDEHISGVVLVLREVTEQRQLALQRQRADKLESLGVLAGGIAHDFNNILTTILGNLSLARFQLAADSPVKHKLDEVEEAMLRARGLTQQLLTFSKGGAPVRKAASIAEVIMDTTVFALTGTAVQYHVEMAPDLWPVIIDTGQISQVVHNLVMNAAQAMGNSGTLTVTVRNATLTTPDAALPPGAYIRFDVQDTGPGIAPEHVAKIFDPYFTTKSEGSGLGLSVCYSIVQNHGGDIRVKSEPGVGSTFSVLLPAAPEAQAETPAPVPAPQVAPRARRILIMDDDTHIREMLEEIITTLGFTARGAANGEEMLARFSEARAAGTPYDIVLMDLTIRGGMGGKEAIAQLLALDPEACAIVSSGYATDPIMSEYARYGFRGVITKPFRVDDLLKVINEVQGR
jgi:PAS domain S-box-containing protein